MIMDRKDIINLLIKKYNLKKYLEIGIGDGYNFKSIICDFKTNVDPFLDNRSGQSDTFPPINRMTSDDFFRISDDKFDIVFVDGLHTFDQTLLDINNSLNCLNDGGFVIAHDMLPPSEWHQRDSNELEGGEWNGTCWKAVAYLRTTNPNLDIKTIDTDWGVSIIRKEKSEIFNKLLHEIDYNFYSENKNELMNVISVKDFLSIYIN